MSGGCPSRLTTGGGPTRGLGQVWSLAAKSYFVPSRSVLVSITPFTRTRILPPAESKSIRLDLPRSSLCPFFFPVPLDGPSRSISHEIEVRSFPSEKTRCVRSTRGASRCAITRSSSFTKVATRICRSNERYRRG